MENKEKYIRVGTQLFKTVRRPMISGDFVEEKVAWSYETLRQDYGKNNLPEIGKYDGFCIIPDHMNYKQVHGTYLNQYEPTPCQPVPGEFPHIRSFLEHIFGDQLELGLDYLQILYLRPTQMLPILLLVSNERNTGKTTFLRFFKMIFGKNATFNRREIEFFAKFVLCSNNEKNPIIIPQEEVRFWVRKIEPVAKDNIRLREQMSAEIPHFLYFLLHRELSTHNTSRMWFAPAQLETPALRKIKKYNTNKVEIEIATYCADAMEKLGKDTVSCCPKDMLDVVKDAGLRADLAQIRSIFKDSWGLRSDRNGDYTFYQIGFDGELFPVKKKGRYFEISRELVDKLLL